MELCLRLGDYHLEVAAGGGVTLSSYLGALYISCIYSQANGSICWLVKLPSVSVWPCIENDFAAHGHPQANIIGTIEV
jgi:hypothetical protein